MQVLYADDTVLVGYCEFERSCDNMALKINVGKSKFLMIKKDQLWGL